MTKPTESFPAAPESVTDSSPREIDDTCIQSNNVHTCALLGQAENWIHVDDNISIYHLSVIHLEPTQACLFSNRFPASSLPQDIISTSS